MLLCNYPQIILLTHNFFMNDNKLLHKEFKIHISLFI